MATIVIHADLNLTHDPGSLLESDMIALRELYEQAGADQCDPVDFDEIQGLMSHTFTKSLLQALYKGSHPFSIGLDLNDEEKHIARIE